MDFDGGVVSSRIENEDGKIDLNLVSAAGVAVGRVQLLGIDLDVCNKLVEGAAAWRRVAGPALPSPRQATGTPLSPTQMLELRQDIIEDSISRP
jgi:hypothetical protein